MTLPNVCFIIASIWGDTVYDLITRVELTNRTLEMLYKEFKIYIEKSHQGWLFHENLNTVVYTQRIQTECIV